MKKNDKEESMEKRVIRYIEDEEISLQEKDYLNTSIYADSLKNIIDSLSGNKSYTVGLFGGWGTGKSSIINTVKELYKCEKKRDIAFVTYDAWQYVNDSFRRMFLLKMQQELKYAQTDLMKKFYMNESQKVDYKYVPSFKKLATIVFVMLIVIVFLVCADFINYEEKINVAMIFSIVNISILICFRTFEKFDISITKPYLFAPEQFQECFTEILNACFSSNPIEKVKNFLRVGNGSVSGLKKLVIVFDNIDRCHHDLAYSLLTDIKTFLAPTNKNVIFVIPVDDGALKKNFKNDSCSEDKDKEEFLRKFFNMVIRIKPYAEMDMFEFAKNVAVENKMNFKPETLYFASSAYSKNPRRIIQLYNNLEAEKLNYKESFAEKYESQICALLIMREDYPKCYQKILRNPQILLNENMRDGQEQEENQFLRMVAPSFKVVPLVALSRILSNTELYFTSLDSDLKDALDTFDDKYLDENKEKYVDSKSKIVDYLNHTLDKYIRNNVDAAIVSSFEFYSKIYEMIGLKNEWKRFDDLFERMGYAEIYRRVPKSAAICKFIDYLTSGVPSYPNAQEQFIDYLISEKEPAPEFGDEQYLCCHSEKMLKKLSEKLLAQYNNFNSWSELEPIHLRFLITDDFLLMLVSEINSLENGDVSLSRCVIILSKRDSVSGTCYSSFFEKVHSLVKAKGLFESYFNMVLCLIKVTENKSKEYFPKTNEIQLILQKIDQTFLQRLPQYSNKLLLDLWKTPKTIDVLLRYMYERIRLMGESAAIQKIVKELLADYLAKVISLYNRLIDEKNDITMSMGDVIAVLNDFSNREQLNILRYAALYQENHGENGDTVKYMHSDSVIAKIPALFNYLAQDEVVDLICELDKIPVYAEIVKNQFSQRNDIEITGKLVPLALNDFTKERLDQYKGNYEFLQFVLKQGREDQKRLVANILLDNIHAGTFLNQTFDVIEKTVKSISRPIKAELIAATEDLLSRLTGVDLESAKEFLEKFKNN